MQVTYGRKLQSAYYVLMSKVLNRFFLVANCLHCLMCADV